MPLEYSELQNIWNSRILCTNFLRLMLTDGKVGQVGCSELGEIRYREINGYEPKSVTVNWKVCRGFRKTQRSKHCQMLNSQPPLGAGCELSFWATSDSSDFRKPLHTFEIGWNSVTLSCGFRPDLRLRRCAYRFRAIYALWHYLEPHRTSICTQHTVHT